MVQSFILLALMQVAPPRSPFNVEDIVDRMMQADQKRLAESLGYSGMRRYRFENKRFNKRAEMSVRVVCDRTGAKTFEVVAESGSPFVRSHIIGRMIDAERTASEKNEHEQTRILPKNYDFRLLGTEMSDGRLEYVLEISPKTRNRFLVQGRIWIDSEDFAITRVEGAPAKNPSIWIRSVQIVQRYQRVGTLWLPASNRSRAEARIFGSTEVAIDYYDYATNDGHTRARSAGAERFSHQPVSYGPECMDNRK